VTEAVVRVSPAWLELREPADARARSTGLVDRLRRQLRHAGTTVVHDLGSATGSMTRWLAPRLDGPQHWVLHDRDWHLLERAADAVPTAADGSAVTMETRLGDITRLGPEGLAGASLVTASALLDMLTADELDRLVTSCSGAGCPVLLTLSVIGRVELAPADPLDATLGAAFDDHQRRPVGAGSLVGPDAARLAVARFRDLGGVVTVRRSPWFLGASSESLAGQWLAGWVGAACEQGPELEAACTAYLARRAADLAAGRLRVTVHHVDLLALPGSRRD
jgi:hypothetical protein